MKPAVERLIRKEFEGVCEIFTSKSQILGKMTGYADALFDLDLISMDEFTKMYKDIVEYVYPEEE